MSISAFEICWKFFRRIHTAAYNVASSVLRNKVSTLYVDAYMRNVSSSSCERFFNVVSRHIIRGILGTIKLAYLTTIKVTIFHLSFKDDLNAVFFVDTSSTWNKTGQGGRGGRRAILSMVLTVWPEKNHQMPIKVAQK